MNNIEQLLVNIGLTKQEARCYSALYTMKESRAGRLAKESGIATANLYSVLEQLRSKGLVSYRLQNNIRIFFASSHDVLNEFVQKKQDELNQQKAELDIAIAKLKVGNANEEPQANYRYYEGLSGIKAMWYEIESRMLRLQKNAMLRIHSSRTGTFEGFLAFYDNFHKARMKRGIGYRLLLTTSAKSHGQKRSRQNAEVRFLHLDNEVQWGTIDTFYFIYYTTGKKPYAFLIDDKKFAESFTAVFDNLWKIAKNK